MPLLYEVSVIAPDRVVFEGKIESMVAPGSEGYFGVLAGHAPMVAELGWGELKLRTQGGDERYYAVARGFVEVGWDRVTVLVDSAEAAEEIDVDRAQAARERAERRLRARSENVDEARAEAALRRALNRLHVASHHGRR